jgi:hypothetical protein
MRDGYGFADYYQYGFAMDVLGNESVTCYYSF